MKEIRKLLIGMLFGCGLILGLHLLHAQERATPIQSDATSPTLANTDWSSASDLAVMLQAVEMTTPAAANAVPRFGTFFSAQHSPTSREPWPPLPGNIRNVPVWNLGDGFYLLDDAAVNYNAALFSYGKMTGMTTMMAGSFANSYGYGNAVRLTNMTAIASGYGNMTASFNIAGGTNNVPYDILMGTNVSAPFSQWTWLGIGYTSNNYTFYGQPADVGFYILAKPSKTMTVGFGDDTVGQCDVPFGLTNAVQVAGGAGHSLALLNNGTVMAWGWNPYGQATVPANLAGVAMIAAGWYHSAALLTNGSVRAWGYNGAGLYNLTEVPPDLTNATIISAQAMHTLALRNDGTVAAWGYGPSGEATVPVGLSNVVAISAGYNFNLVVTSNGMVTAWGGNSEGQCNVPAGLSNVVDVAAGTYHSLALLKNGGVAAWGDNLDGETSVPLGLSNVVAIEAGGDPGIDSAYSLALKSDGTVIAWGDDGAVDPVGGLSNVIGIAAGADHALAIRTGPRTPIITLEPTDQYQLTNGTVTFTSRGAGLYGVTYQWQFNDVNIPGATNTTLTVTNVQSTNASSYTVVVSDNGGMGSIVSSNAIIYLVTAPVISRQTLPTNQVVLYQGSVTLSAVATAPGQNDGFPLSYQWQFNGTNIPGATSSNYTFSAVNSGTYSLIVSNAAGSVSVSWQVNVVYPGGVAGWGDDSYGQYDPPFGLTNAAVIAAGEYHSVAVKDDGSVVQWGYDWGDIPANLTNAVSVAAGYEHSIALRSDGTVVTWGYSNCPGNVVPPNLAGVKAVAAGWLHSVVLLTNGTVMAWGDDTYGQTNVPADLTNVTAISACSRHSLALKSDGTVEGWGYNYDGITTAPAGLSNVVAIATGYVNSLVLKSDGTVVVWGDNSGGQTNVPVGLSNVMAVAAGWYHCVALRNDGTVVAWGDNTYGQTNVISSLNHVKLLAAAENHTLAGVFSPLVQYPVDVTKDVLLIYNSNSTNSITLKDYYLAHRPMIAGANVLGVACDTNEITSLTNYTTQIAAPALNWLTNNPTKRPQYVVLFYDMPTRLSSYPAGYGSVGYNLTIASPSWAPYVNYINGGTLTDCEAYVDKIAYFGTNYSSGKLVISASSGGYGNTNFVLDDIRNGGPSPQYESFSGSGSFISSATNNLLAAGVCPNAMFFYDGLVISNNLSTAPPHATGLTNVAGYICWGVHGSLSGTYPVDGSVVWNGNSGWWVIETIESFNGQRSTGQGNFIEWFSSNAFGGTDYSHTPVGAVSHVEEPQLGFVENSSVYFGLWAAGKDFAICAWNARKTPYFQAVGDPLVTK